MIRLKEVIAIANHKGGVGKTTTVQSIAAALVREKEGCRVLVIDLDEQMHLSMLFGWEPTGDNDSRRTVYDAMQKGDSLPVYDTNREGVFMVPGSAKMNTIDADLFRQMSPKMVLAKCFRQPLEVHSQEKLTTILRSFDYVLIDCPPALSQTTYNAMAVATGLLIPVQMKGLSVNGVGKILVALREVQQELNPTLTLKGILPTMVDGRPRLVKDFREYMHKNFKGVTNTLVRSCIKIDEAQTRLKDIYMYKPYSTVGEDYTKLTRELFG